jgi:HK97 family phage major capsid protein
MNIIMGESDLTDDLMTEYEGLERSLAEIDRRDALTRRHADITRPDRGIPQGGENRDLGNVEYERAFDTYLRTGQVNRDLVQSRSQSEGTASEGGYLVPDSYRQRLVDRMVAFGGLAGVVETITTGDGRRLPWPTIDDTTNVGEIVQEGTAFVSGADLVFGSASLDAYSYASGGAGGQALRVSYELAQDSAFDLAGVVARKLGERIARIQAVHLVRGSGVDQPVGITTDRVGVELESAAFTYAGLLNMVHAVDPAYRAAGRWAFNDNTLQAIRGLVDTTGRPLLKTQNDGIDSNPGGTSLLGYPVTIDQAFPDAVLNDDAINWGVFGDLSEGYVVRRVREVELLVNPYSRMNNREIEYSAWARMDATQQNTNAYVALTGFEA